MKSKISKKTYICLFLCLSVMLLLAACATPESMKNCVRTYILSSVSLDGEELEAHTVYPQGGSLRLYDDGTGRIYLGEMSSAIGWQSTDDSYTLVINSLCATGEENSGVLTLTMGDTGLVYEFAEGEPGESGTAYAPETKLQSEWNGEWQGRMWFYDPEGEWQEYEDRSMEIKASVYINEEGEGSIRLNNDAYSAEIPLAEFGISISEYKHYSREGFMMGFPLNPGEVEIELRSENPDELESTVVIHPEEFNWYVPEFGIYPEETEPEPVTVLRLSGKCSDENGSFIYKVELSR